MPGDVPASGPDVAQRLGEWLSALDSVRLDGALQTISAYGKQTRQAGQTVDAQALGALCQQTRDHLTALIRHQPLPDEPTYPPHLQHYAALQKQMEQKVSACRSQVRLALRQGPPRLRQLAALDEVMTQMLGEREQKLLAAVPLYLERRFEQCRQTAPDPTPGDDPSADKASWLPLFHQDMRQMLLSELQLRLQPVLGLIEAAHPSSGSPA